MKPDVDLWRRAERVFAAALECSREERDALVQGACAGDDALTRAVDILLASHDGDVFVDTPLLRPSVRMELEPPSTVGESIGPYRLLRLIGEGGTSRVFLAERVGSDFPQWVAIKLIRDGRLGPAILRRFRRERRILAGLQHPNIARLLDGGARDDGVPYVVMEYVQGVPITRYCDARRLTVRERLEVFRSVCEAVRHAHASLVIHRDIKPNNILVTEEGSPKLLDFGIATHLGSRRPGTPDDATATAERALTPEYASPEQIAGAPLTTATDVYSLGVLLHELLVGRRPSADPHLDPPSAAVGRPVHGADEAEPLAVAAARGVKPRELRRQVAGDLDNIVRRALRSEPSQRYSSVEQLSQDIGWHLAGRPITARPPSFAYRARKFVRRNTLAVALGGSAALSVAAVGGVFVHEGARVRRERDTAVLERQRAENERQRTAEVTRFLVETFEQADPHHAGGPTTTARELLDRSAQRITASASPDPALRATLLSTIGSVYRSLGVHDTARPLLMEALTVRRRVHGETSREVAETLMQLGRLDFRSGDGRAAEKSFRRALALRRVWLGNHHVDVAESLAAVGETLRERGDYRGAEPLLREALSLKRKHLGTNHLDVASALDALGYLLYREGKLDEGETLYRQALVSFEGSGHREHPASATALAHLALLLEDKGHSGEAEPLLHQALEIRRRAYGDRHPLVGQTLNALAGVLVTKGDYAAAERHQRHALALCRTAFPPGHPSCGVSLAMLAGILTAKGDAAAAEPMAREALAVIRRAMGPDHPLVGAALHVVGTVLVDRGRFAEAERILNGSVTLRRRRLGARHWAVGNTLILLADAQRARGRASDAAALASEAVDILSRELPAGHWRTAMAGTVLGDSLVALGRLEEARPLVLEGVTAARATQEEGGYFVRRALQALARYESAHRRLSRSTPPTAATN